MQLIHFVKTNLASHMKLLYVHLLIYTNSFMLSVDLFGKHVNFAVCWQLSVVFYK